MVSCRTTTYPPQNVKGKKKTEHQRRQWRAPTILRNKLRSHRQYVAATLQSRVMQMHPQQHSGHTALLRSCNPSSNAAFHTKLRRNSFSRVRRVLDLATLFRPHTAAPWRTRNERIRTRSQRDTFPRCCRS